MKHYSSKAYDTIKPIAEPIYNEIKSHVKREELTFLEKYANKLKDKAIAEIDRRATQGSRFINGMGLAGMPRVMRPCASRQH